MIPWCIKQNKIIIILIICILSIIKSTESHKHKQFKNNLLYHVLIVWHYFDVTFFFGEKQSFLLSFDKFLFFVN